MSDQARTRLLTILPHLQCAAEMARAHGVAQIYIVGKRADGTGQGVADFGADEFIADLASVLDEEGRAVAEERARGEAARAAADKLLDIVTTVGVVDLNDHAHRLHVAAYEYRVARDRARATPSAEKGVGSGG